MTAEADAGIAALARRAAALWGARDPVPVAERENVVLAMRLPDGTRAALRLHRPGYQSAEAVRSELALSGLLAGAGFPTPAPVPARDGALVQDLGPRLASAVRWCNGQPLAETAPPADLARLGALLARLHDTLDRLALPAGFQRPRWDAEGLLGAAPLWGRFWDSPSATRAESARLDAARPALDAVLADLPDFGLIHADVLRENVLDDGGRLTLIDFDDCGWGWRAFDLATALVQSQDRPTLAQDAAALLEGYAARRPLPPDAPRHVTLCALLRACASIGWLASRRPPDHPGHRLRLDRALRLLDLWERGGTLG